MALPWQTRATPKPSSSSAFLLEHLEKSPAHDTMTAALLKGLIRTRIRSLENLQSVAPPPEQADQP